MHPEIDTEKIQWRGRESGASHDWDYVERWLENYGWSFGDPAFDAVAAIDTDCTAFRIDSIERGKPVSIVVVATIDHDADGTADGWHDLSRAVRVEVIRC